MYPGFLHSPYTHIIIIQEYPVIAHDQSYDSVIAYAMIDIEAALAKAMKHLGYNWLSFEQCKAIMHFVAPRRPRIPSDWGWQVSLLPSLANSTKTFDKRRYM